MYRLDHEADFFGCPDGSHRTGSNGGNCPGSRAMLHRAGTADIDRGIIFLLTSASLLHEPVRLDGLAD